MTRIRPFQDGDAEAMATLYVRAVREIGARDYSPAQVEAWAGGASRSGLFRQKMADGRRCWVALGENGQVTAFVDLEADGHIDFLYAAPEVAGRGVAGALMDVLEAAATQSGLERLYVEASEPARRFFTRRGFDVLYRRDVEVEGVPIHNYAMERRL
ncbi:MAG: GNAT family N-acetyltransferase [Brevundimonas sp.]